jgi:acetylglutamate kinase
MSAVIKVGGRAQGDARLAALLAARWRANPGALVVVHGGGDEVSALQRAAGVEPVFVGGRRVTAPDDIDRLRMALSGLANKRLVAALVAAGLDAVGVSGEDAGLLVAAVIDDGALGRVGTVRTVRRAILAHLLGGGYLPVVSPLATPGLNVNGDDAASAVAVALEAEELLFVSDVPGVRVGGAPVARIDASDAAVAIDSGEIGGGMAAKVQAALYAIAGGVASVRIGDLAIIDDVHAGTTVVAAATGALS